VTLRTSSLIERTPYDGARVSDCFYQTSVGGIYRRARRLNINIVRFMNCPIATNQDIRFCTANDGVKLAYAVTGDGPPLVMASTWLTHLEHQWRSLAWRPWLDTFREFKVLRHDSRGCGLSDRDTDKLSFENWVNDLARVVDAAGFDRFPILATCWGGPVAVEYAARYPKRVSHLVLYGTYARGRLQVGDADVTRKARLMLELTRLGWGKENDAFMQVWSSTFQPGGTLDYLRSWAEQMRLATTAENAVRLLEIGWSADVREAARKLKCPVLVIHAERDCAVPIAEGRLLASLIPDCRFIQFDSQNHMPLLDEPEWPRLIAEIQSFLAKPDAVTSTRHDLPLEELTNRERTVLECIADGLDNSEIASILGLSEKTVRNHITRVFDKIQVQHRYQAIVRARDAGLGTRAAARR
jgi:pimeloyl-ACP methyl ester carboxylesterase/DNA-binding CsgD family transcriptional regulator